MQSFLIDNGPLAAEFLSVKKREGVVKLYNCETDIEKDNIRELLHRFNVISRTISHTKYIDADGFEVSERMSCELNKKCFFFCLFFLRKFARSNLKPL